MTVPTTTRSDHPPAVFYRALRRLHGHRCPMSILGARLGWAAAGALCAAKQERLAARFYHRTCALDGIQLSTNCTLGNGNLEVSPDGMHRLELWRQGGGPRVSAVLSAEALRRGRTYARMRELREAEEGSGTTPEMEDLLRGLEVAPTEELVELLWEGPG